MRAFGPIVSLIVIVASLAPCADAGTGRAVSLNAIRSTLKTGGSRQAESLCGLTRVAGYIVDTKQRDIILIGTTDPSAPALRLEDLAVALRSAWLTYAEKRGNVRYYTPPGCSIDPDASVLGELQRVGDKLSCSKGSSQIKACLDEWNAIGCRPQKVRVMGVPFDTRFAKVMVDADYYMKRLVNGSVWLGIPGFESLSDLSAEVARKRWASGGSFSDDGMSLNRFWFCPGEATYEEQDGAVILRSCAVQLLTEEEFLTEHGEIAGRGRPGQLAKQFARSFSDHYPEIAAERSIYTELESLFRFAGVARLVKAESIKCAGIDYLLGGYRVKPTPVSRTVPGLTHVKEVSDRQETEEGIVTVSMVLPSCGGVSMDVRPRRVKSASAPTRVPPKIASSPQPQPSAPPRKPSAKSGPAVAAKPRAAARPAVTLKKAVLSARTSPKAMSWDFDVPGDE